MLANGSVYRGHSFGYSPPKNSIVYGEICFNTSMTGYQEILTDPSYRKQIIVMTYPLIGNYGINEGDSESKQIQVAGLIVKSYVEVPVNFSIHKNSKRKSLATFLREFQIPALENIDTRKLVLEIRNQGVLNARIIDEQEYSLKLLKELQAMPPIERLDLLSEVTTPKNYTYSASTPQKKYCLAVLDMGIKKSILKYLDQSGFYVKVFSANCKFEDMEKTECHAFFLSNGPGNPATMHEIISKVKRMENSGKPIFGICLGHQILAIANGLSSYKLKFGHRGGNQPVINKKNGRVEITAQNHGYAVTQSPEKNNRSFKLTSINLNDLSTEGFENQERSELCVQYHPEGAPGPHDALHLFQDFYRLVDQHYRQGKND